MSLASNLPKIRRYHKRGSQHRKHGHLHPFLVITQSEVANDNLKTKIDQHCGHVITRDIAQDLNWLQGNLNKHAIARTGRRCMAQTLVASYWARWRFRSPASPLFTQPFFSADQRKHQSSASLAFVRGIHQWPQNVSIWWRHHENDLSCALSCCTRYRNRVLTEPVCVKIWYIVIIPVVASHHHVYMGWSTKLQTSIHKNLQHQLYTDE